MKYIVDNKEYEVIVTKKFNRHTYIRVNNNKEILVTTNFLSSKKDIFSLIKKHEKKIVKMLNKTVNKEIDGSKFYYLGSIYDIITIPTISEITFDSNKVYSKDMEHLNKWLTNKTKEIFQSRYDIIYNYFDEDIPYFHLSYRKMKTRWGVCNRRSKKITLNTNLIKYDVAVIDYVIIHELAHLIHFNHSKDFWNLVMKYCKEYKRIRRHLREQ